MINRREFIQAISAATTSAAHLANISEASPVTSEGHSVATDQTNLTAEEFSPEDVRIKVLGVGGGGSLAVEHMMAGNLAGVELICADSDAGALTRRSAHKLIQLGRGELGANCTPENGQKSAEASLQDIRATIQGAHMLFITVVLGGNTGTDAAPVIARLAREMGILTVVRVLTQPFNWKDSRGMPDADASLAELEASADAVIVMRYAKLLAVLGEDAAPDEALAYANSILKNVVRDTALAVNVPCHVGVDFEDVRTVLGVPGKAVIGAALACGPDRARIAAERAVASPLFEGVNLANAQSVLVLVSAVQGRFKLSDSKSAMTTIRASASPEAHVIYGTTYDDELGDAIRVTVIAMGLSRQGG